MIKISPFDALALSLHHSPGTQALLIGSGLSRAAEIPTGWEITLDLIRKLAALQGVTQHENWEGWFKGVYGGKDPSYSEILNMVASSESERRKILHHYIEPFDSAKGSRLPTKAHQAIARLVKAGAIRVIVTTNFDRLVENALRDEGIEPTVITSEDDIVGAQPLVHSPCTVIKVHGDYLDNRIKNTNSELASYGSQMNDLLNQVFDNFGLTVVGWSGEWDTALRDAITRQPNRRFPFYWAGRGNVGQHAQDLIQQRGGRSFVIKDADSFFAKLDQQLDALREASRPHPQSVEMAIALAKRYCRDDRFAMEWTEFLHFEVEKIRTYISGPDYPISSNVNSLNGIVSQFITRTELLRRACLICGRWGTKEANQAVVSAIKSLVISEKNCGYVALAELQKFAASICFYWNLAGIIDHRDWVAAQTLISTEMNTRHGKKLLIELLPFNCFDSVQWKFLTGLERQPTPISDFVQAIFISEAGGISVNSMRADELFDETELLVCITFGHNRLRQDPERRISFYMPIGRFMCKGMRDLLPRQLDRLAALPDGDPLFQSGLLGRNQTEAKPTLDAARKFHEMFTNSFWC